MALQLSVNRIVYRVGVLAIEFEPDAEDLGQLIADPDAGRGRAEEMPILADQPPNLPMIALRGFRPVFPLNGGRFREGYAKLVQRYPLRIQHTEDVMIGDDEQIDRAAKLIIGVGEEAWIDVAVRAYQGQVLDACVEFPRGRLLPRVHREIAILHGWFSSRLSINGAIVPLPLRFARK